MKKFDITMKFVQSEDPADFAAAIDEKTKGIYVESIGNPKNTVAPLPELAKVRYCWLCPTLASPTLVKGCP